MMVVADRPETTGELRKANYSVWLTKDVEAGWGRASIAVKEEAETSSPFM
jgi:hypothetical protein